MKKALILGAVLAGLAAPAANAGSLIIEPTIITGAPAYVEPAYVQPPAVIVAPAVYPVHYDHHHHYDWRYWHHDRR